MKKILLINLFIIVSLGVFAQQQPMLSQYMFNNYYFNPAYTGSGELYNFTFLNRSQWSGYKDYQNRSVAPEMQLFTATANIDSTGHSFGLMASRDKAGASAAHQINVSYAYSIQVTQHGKLTLGVRGGINSRSIDYGQFIIKDPDDPFIHEGKQSQTKPDLAVGLWYSHSKYYVGVSARGVALKSTYEALGLKSEQDIMVTAGYYFNLDRDWTLTPSAQLVTNTNHLYTQVSGIVSYANIFWGGLAYRHNDAASLIAGFSAIEKKLRVSYSFDYTTGNRDIKTGTSHEIMVTYNVGKLRSRKLSL